MLCLAVGGLICGKADTDCSQHDIVPELQVLLPDQGTRDVCQTIRRCRDRCIDHWVSGEPGSWERAPMVELSLCCMKVRPIAFMLHGVLT